jgi:hypothetical protein
VALNPNCPSFEAIAIPHFVRNDWRMSTLAQLLVDLMTTAPGLVPIYREHLALHDALLPDLFMTQVAAWVSGTMHAVGQRTIPDGAGGEEARTVVAVIESHLTSGDAEVRELISLSFLDSVDASPANEVLRLHFGPSLRAEAARRDGWSFKGSDPLND